jgi:serine/threonine protein phosphatase PrpC
VGDEARQRWEVLRIAIEHRVGRCDVGEPTVAVAVSASHRGEAFEAARAAVADTVGGLEADRAASRTALVLALIGSHRLTIAGLGDARVAVVRGSRTTLMGAATAFLGPSTDLATVSLDETELDPGDRVVAASDGLFDFLGPDWADRLATLASDAGPTALVRRAVEAAFLGGAGDNVAVAVISVDADDS